MILSKLFLLYEQNSTRMLILNYNITNDAIIVDERQVDEDACKATK